MHPRMTPANERVAHSSLEHAVSGVTYTDGNKRSVVAPVADLRRSPDGPLDCQLRFGAPVLVLEERDGWAFGQSIYDDYVGYFRISDLGEATTPTHKVTTFGSHEYAEPSLKTVPLRALPFLAEITSMGEVNGYHQTPHGYIPSQHVSKIDTYVGDFVTTAERHLGVPYLWGGDSHWGLDCSGLVQTALACVGVGALRDTDMQEASLGVPLPEGADLQRGDIIFWKGHVGIMQDGQTLIHANAHHMSVTSEDFTTVCKRVEQAGDGPVTSRKRL